MHNINVHTKNKNYLEDQLARYNTLSWYKSHRKLSGVIVLTTAVLTIGLGSVVIAPIAYFIYKGKKIAIILGQIFLLFALVSNLSALVEFLRDAQGNVTSHTSLWYGSIFILTVYGLSAQQLWFAYQVEKGRTK